MKVNKYLTFFLALFVLMVTVTPTGAAENTSNVKKSNTSDDHNVRKQ